MSFLQKKRALIWLPGRSIISKTQQLLMQLAIHIFQSQDHNMYTLLIQFNYQHPVSVPFMIYFLNMQINR